MFWMQLISITQSGTNIDLEKFQQQITSNPFQVGLAWVEPRLLFNNIFDWDVRRSVKVTFVSNVFGKKVQFSRPMKSWLNTCGRLIFTSLQQKGFQRKTITTIITNIITIMIIIELHTVQIIIDQNVIMLIRLERISTLKNAGTVTIFRNGSVHYDSHIRLTVGQFFA